MRGLRPDPEARARPPTRGAALGLLALGAATTVVCARFVWVGLQRGWIVGRFQRVYAAGEFRYAAILTLTAVGIALGLACIVVGVKWWRRAGR